MLWFLIMFFVVVAFYVSVNMVFICDCVLFSVFLTFCCWSLSSTSLMQWFLYVLIMCLVVFSLHICVLCSFYFHFLRSLSLSWNSATLIVLKDAPLWSSPSSFGSLRQLGRFKSLPLICNWNLNAMINKNNWRIRFLWQKPNSETLWRWSTVKGVIRTSIHHAEHCGTNPLIHTRIMCPKRMISVSEKKLSVSGVTLYSWQHPVRLCWKIYEVSTPWFLSSCISRARRCSRKQSEPWSFHTKQLCFSVVFLLFC